MPQHRMPPAWADAGARWGADGLLYLAEWRRGFTPHELRALFFDCQQVRTLRRERDDALARSEQALIEIERLERSVYWYRRQLVAEARLGVLLATLGHDPGEPGFRRLGGA
jgi:hypothetical protein